MSDIRKAADKDIPSVKAIWEESVRATHHFLTEDEISFYKNLLPEYLRHVDLHVLDRDGTIDGFSGIAGRKLEMLFVTKRGSGSGSKLLGHAISLGVTEVDVNEENTRATKFYQDRGFIQVGCSENDNEGKPHPILHLALTGESRRQTSPGQAGPDNANR